MCLSMKIHLSLCSWQKFYTIFMYIVCILYHCLFILYSNVNLFPINTQLYSLHTRLNAIFSLLIIFFDNFMTHSRAGSRIFCRGGVDPFGGGVWPPTWALFSENVCENERIGSCRGACAGHAPLDPPMHRTPSFRLKRH